MLRLRQICLVASELAGPVAGLEAVFGLSTCYRDPNVARYGLENALLPVGTDFLEVVAPTRAGTAAGRYLERRGGDGGYIVILQCNDAAAREARMATIGVRVVNRLHHGPYLGVQLHPRDTGGAMIETSRDDRDETRPDGPWHPAGDDWAPHVRTGVVAAMTACELQSDDPAALAARWAEVLDLPVGADSGGNPALSLDNATIRFVPAADGRGEGLAAVDLKTVDREHLLKQAIANGCPIDDDTVTVCGTRFHLV